MYALISVYFTLTNSLISKVKMLGWFFSAQPPGAGPRFPEALCIVSPIGEFGMYEQLLRTLQEYRSHSMDNAVELMEVAYARSMPLPNKEVYIRTDVRIVCRAVVESTPTRVYQVQSSPRPPKPSQIQFHLSRVRVYLSRVQSESRSVRVHVQVTKDWVQVYSDQNTLNCTVQWHSNVSSLFMQTEL